MDKKKSKQGGDCCGSGKNTNKSGKGGVLAGIAYGLIPHAGCIAFILFAVLGVTAATTFFKPLMLNPYFFYALVGMSFGFATLSAALYLRKNGSLSSEGVRSRWRYLSILYGTTILVNLFLFTVVFPYTANIISKPVDSLAGEGQTLESLALQVDIPCSGHAALITDELNKLDGVRSVRYSLPNRFDVKYDPALVSQEKILGISVFKDYKATLV